MPATEVAIGPRVASKRRLGVDQQGYRGEEEAGGNVVGGVAGLRLHHVEPASSATPATASGPGPRPTGRPAHQAAKSISKRVQPS